MKASLTPKYERSFNDVLVLWFCNSNRYVVVSKELYSILAFYFKAKNANEFITLLKSSKTISIDEAKTILSEVKEFIEESNIIEDNITQTIFSLDKSKRHFTEMYCINSNSEITVHYDSKIVKQLIHPSLAYLSTNKDLQPNAVFDIYLENDMLCLFHNENFIDAFPKKEFHKLQGKFAMELLCVQYKKQEHDWLGIFHASTVSNGKEAIMCIGDSGNGKSTFTALLMANGFKLVADDVTPMLAKNKHIYHNLSAISIKQGAFKTLSPLLENFEDLPSHFINNTKGVVKYIPPKNNSNTNHFPCKTIVYVNYKKNANTKLKTTSIEKALQTLIPDSWISPKPENAKHFLDWLETVSFYELTYSDSDEAIASFSKLFKQ